MQRGRLSLTDSTVALWADGLDVATIPVVVGGYLEFRGELRYAFTYRLQAGIQYDPTTNTVAPYFAVQ